MSESEHASVMGESNIQTIEGGLQCKTSTQNNENVSNSDHASKKAKVSVTDSTGNPKGKSLVWEWFAKFKDTEGREKAKCKHCNKIYAADPKKNGTTALRTHMMHSCCFRILDAEKFEELDKDLEKDAAGASVEEEIHTDEN